MSLLGGAAEKMKESRARRTQAHNVLVEKTEAPSKKIEGRHFATTGLVNLAVSHCRVVYEGTMVHTQRAMHWSDARCAALS